MSDPIDYAPKTLDFGLLAPGASHYSGVGFTAAPSPTTVSARVEHTTPGGRFEVYSLESFAEVPMDDSTGPPRVVGSRTKGKGKAKGSSGTVTELQAHMDGGGPLHIDAQGELQVNVSFTASDKPIPPHRPGLPFSEDDTVRGTLVVESDKWGIIRIPMVATIAHITTSFVGSPNPSVRQGSTVDLPITVTSVAGPPTTVTYEELSGTIGISLAPLSIHLGRGESKSASLQFSVAPDAPLGKQEVDIVLSAFGDKQRNMVIPSPVFTVLPGQVTVKAETPGLTADQGLSYQCLLDIATGGSAATVKLVPSPPAGVHLYPASIHLGLAEEKKHQILGLSVDPTAPIGTFPFSIAWSAYDDTPFRETGTVPLSITINPGEVTVTPIGVPTVNEGATANFEVHIATTGSKTNVDIAPVKKPAWLTMGTSSFTLTDAGSVYGLLKFSLSDGAPVGVTSVTASWSAYGGKRPGTVSLPLKINEKPASGGSSVGFSKVLVQNCRPEGREVHIWVNDITARTGWEEKGTQPSQYDAAGFCPDPTSTPFELPLVDGHAYLIAVVDPDNPGCGGVNDPNDPECRINEQSCVGAKGGPVGYLDV